MIFERIMPIILCSLLSIVMLYMGVTERRKYKEAEKKKKEAISHGDKIQFKLSQELDKIYVLFFIIALPSLVLAISGIISTIINLVTQ